MTGREVLGIFHAGITVSNMDRALEFYRDLLGLDVLYDREATSPYLARLLNIQVPDIRIVFLHAGPADAASIELLEYRSLSGSTAGHDPWDPGSGHVCFSVVNVDRLYTAVIRSGYEVRSEPVDIVSGPNFGSRAFYVKDPDGHWIELFQRPLPAGSPT